MTRSSLTHFMVLSAAWATLGAGFGLAQSAEDLRMTVGKSVVIDYPADIRQISTSNPEVVDASPVTTREILLHGKGLGSATMVVWSKAGQRTFYNVTVDLNLDPLRRLLKESFPNEDIQPHSSRDSISLNGRVSNKDLGDRAVALATAYSKTVVNNLQIAAPSISQINTVIPGQNTGFASQFSVTDALNIFAFRPDLNLGAFIKALQTEQILQILAEPNLVATNGKEAYFLVGGEFPVPILQGGANSGAVTVQFREFGIRLIFTPVITDSKTIKMHLKQEVSTLDAADGVTVNGFVIPALSTRRAETDVELSEGQSFVIAGLVDNRETDSFSKIPVLSSLPIFGSLFKTKDEKKTRTELVVLVTPELTEPLGADDTKPNLFFPKDFLVRLDPKDVAAAAPATGKKPSKKN